MSTIYKPYKAQPYLINQVGVERFSTIKEAVAYLNEYTGIDMADIDWKVLGKITSIKNRYGAPKGMYTAIRQRSCVDYKEVFGLGG